MRRDSIDVYDILPEDMINYLSNYGRHFNRKLLEFALTLINHDDDTNNSSTGERDSNSHYTREQVDNILKVHGVKLKYNQLYDYVYVANMCKADFLGRSVPDEQHLAYYIKDVIDDKDGYDGIVFNRWYADTRRKGIAIDWNKML